MATNGLRIINDDSELLIDSNYFHPAFVQKLEFNTTATQVEASTGQLHPGYIKRTYTTPAITAPGNYIVMWTLPDNGTNDIWYSFETSTTTIMGSLTCYVYANSTGAALTYSLPTAYLFTTDTLPASTGPALRMYDSTGTKKTFDSNNVQLAPYSLSDSFAFSISGASELAYGATPVSINLSMPTSPVFMLPDFTALRIKKNAGFSQHWEYVYESGFKRVGTSLSTRLFITYYAAEDYAWPYATTTYTTGKSTEVSVLVADANLYEAASGGSGGGGANPTYTLSSNYTSRDEGTTVTVTLTTTQVTNNTQFPYTVTGISAADLSAGGITGYFNVVNNTATATFTFAKDYLTENTETFLLSLDGLSQSISVTVNDTSLTPTYTWAAATSVNEGTTGSTRFTTTNAIDKVVTFAIVAPTTGTAITAADGSLTSSSTWTITSNTGTGSYIDVTYSVTPDKLLEGPEGFRLAATIDGVTYTSDDIIVNDTSKPGYTISAASSSWAESTTIAVTISATNVNGTTLYLTTTNSLVTPASTSVVIDSDSYTTNINYTAGSVTADTSVTLQVRTESTSGTIVATFPITVTNNVPVYTFSAATSVVESSTLTVTIGATYSNNTTFYLTTSNSSLTPASSTITADSDNYSTTVSYASGVVASDTSVILYMRTGSATGTIVKQITVTVTNGTPVYSFSTPTSIDEGTSSSIQFNHSYASGKVITFSLIAPSSGTDGKSRVTLGTTSYTVPSTNNSGNVAVSYSVGNNSYTDNLTYFRVRATVSADSVSTDSSDITINDTSTTPVPYYNITGNSTPWSDYGTRTAAVTINNASGTTVYFTTNNANVVPVTSSTTLSTNSYSTNISYNVADISSAITVTLHIRTGSDTGTILASTTVTISNTYIAPAYNLTNTISGDLSNGGGFNFYHNSTNANGTAVTVSKSGTGASYITISPTSFTISGSSENKSISVTSTNRPPGSQQLSVTISTSTGLSFSFTLAAVPAVQPTVSSVTFLDDPKTIYYAGETITVTVNMSSSIISGGYVRITVFFNGANAGNNVFTSGVTRLPSTYSINFPLGVLSGTWPVVNGPPNLGAPANGTVYFTARAEDTNGNVLGTTRTSRTLTLRSTAPV